VIVCSCLALVGVASQPIDAQRNDTASGAAKVRAVLLQEVTLFNQAHWRTLWRAYSPRVRSHCSYALFVARMKPLRRSVGPATLRNIRIRVTGRRASARYQIVARGKVVGGTPTTNPDVFARIGGRWFDDFDADGLCP
jgi:hypothetical protein